MNNEEAIQYLLGVVKELKEENEQLSNKINDLEEYNETLSSEITELRQTTENNVSKEEMCEYVEEEINGVAPLKEDWEAVYSEKNQRMDILMVIVKYNDHLLHIYIGIEQNTLRSK